MKVYGDERLGKLAKLLGRKALGWLESRSARGGAGSFRRRMRASRSGAVPRNLCHPKFIPRSTHSKVRGHFRRRMLAMPYFRPYSLHPAPTSETTCV